MRADILRRASRLLVQREFPLVGAFDEALAYVNSVETFEESLVGFAEAIIQLVAGCPQCVAACLGQFGQTQARVVCGTGLELDVAVPSCCVVAALVLLAFRGEEFFAGFAADCADFCVGCAEFVGVVQDWVDV